MGLVLCRMLFITLDLHNYQLMLILCAVLGFFRALTVVNQISILADFAEENCHTKLPGTLGLSVVIKALMLVIFGWIFDRCTEASSDSAVNFYLQIILLLIITFVWIIEH